MSTPEEALAHNVSEFMEHGPGLRTTTAVWVCARDDVNGYVYLSGLGGLGVGSMWFPSNERHHTYTGWDDAPIVVTAPTPGYTYTHPTTGEQWTFPGDRVIIEGDAQAAKARTANSMMWGTAPGFRQEDFPWTQ